MSLKVNLYGRELDHSVNYIPFSSFVLTDSKIGIKNVNFHIPSIIEEVKKLPKKEKRRMKQQILAFQTSLATFMMLPLKSMALTENITVSNLPKTAEGMPPEIMELLITLLVIAVGSGVVLAAILLVGAGMGRMFRMKNASAWTSDILKGVIQILIAPSVVFLIYYLSNLVFGNSGWHISPF